MVGSTFSARGAAVACAVLNRRADSEVRNGAMNKRHSGCLGGGVKPSYWTCGIPSLAYLLMLARSLQEMREDGVAMGLLD